MTVATRYYEIEGGKPLHGRVAVGGAKNAATKQIVASLLTDEPVRLHNVPAIGDTAATLEMCGSIGLQSAWDSAPDASLRLHSPSIRSPEVPVAFSGVNRIPILLLGPLLHRYGEAIVPMLGGDDIGKRPVDFHVAALEQLGARITYESGRYHAVAGRLQGAVIDLPYPSVGATENTLFASPEVGTTADLPSMRGQPAFDAALRGEVGSLISTDDGTERIVAYAPVASLGWGIVVSQRRGAAA